MAVQDIRSYEHRIRAHEELAAKRLADHDYRGLLLSAAELLALKTGLKEAEYQTEVAEVNGRD